MNIEDGCECIERDGGEAANQQVAPDHVSEETGPEEPWIQSARSEFRKAMYAWVVSRF